MESLRIFLLEYCSEAFPLPFSSAHIELIEIMEAVMTNGGQDACAMPRGIGKTTIIIRAAIWAKLKNLRRLIGLIGATDKSGKKLLKTAKAILWQNAKLNADFAPELWGIAQLGGTGRRAGGQLCEGIETNITWNNSEIIFPTLPGSAISGHGIYAGGLTGQIRGPNITLADGSVIRPDLAILDDPQTRESAKSATQTEDRIAIIEGDVMGLSGPGTTMACVMPCTVIHKDDLADQMLDRDRHPTWQSQRIKLLIDRPTDEKLWDEYFIERAEGIRTERTSERGNTFYLAHQAALDAGGRSAWPERFNPDEHSAIQHAMNLWYRNPAAFAAEYQQEPTGNEVDGERPTFVGIDTRLNGLARRIVPSSATKLVGFIDVQKDILFYMLMAVSEDFTASVVEYGTEPEQPRSYFTLREVRKTLKTVLGDRGNAVSAEAAIELGLARLMDKICSSALVRQDGSTSRVDKLLIDSGDWTDTVYTAVEHSKFGATVIASKGVGITAARKPMTEAERNATQKPGFHFIESRDKRKRNIPLINYDTNFWKTFAATRVATLGTRQSLQLWGNSPEVHKMLKDHTAAETCVKTEGNGRTVWQWMEVPNHPDNHYLDCLVGCYAAAAVAGCRIEQHGEAVQKQPRVKFSDIQAKKR